ncbi:MAG TPA: hypothetical protein VFG23_07930 [Polyangia bacterium]|nr:hypothetical protein [Polyangia bacterium]
MHPAVAALPLEEKGLVLGALLSRLPPEEVARRFGGPTGRRCRAALETLAGETRAGRAGALASLLALVRAPVPEGIEWVHPGWLRQRLAPEPSAVIRAVCEGLPGEVRRVAEQMLRERGEDLDGPPPVLDAAGLAELRRAIFAALVPLAGPAIPRASAAQPLLELSWAALDEAIELRGAQTLGRSLQGAQPAVIARAAAGLGRDLARAVLDAAAEGGPAAGVGAGRMVARRLVAATAAERSGNDDRAWSLGARTLAAELAGEGPAAALAIAQRLPPERGRRWLAYAGVELG